jgi:altronate hydrolase
LEAVRETGREAELLVIQNEGGTRSTIQTGREKVARMLQALEHTPRAAMTIDELTVGTVCGGSDGTSGITANPAIGRAFDRLVSEKACCIFEETGELIGCEHIMVSRAATPELGDILNDSVGKAARY